MERYRKGEMGVVEVKIQTVEQIYGLVWAAVANKQPMRAIYKDLPRLFCAHRLGRNQAGQRRVLCYQFQPEVLQLQGWSFGRVSGWDFAGCLYSASVNSPPR